MKKIPMAAAQWLRLFLTVLAVAMAPLTSASAQTASPAASAPPPLSLMPVPGELELSKMLWSTMAAIDHANQSGNYSVLRDLSAPAFQQANDAARLAQFFAGIRASRVDLSSALLIAPTYRAAPSVRVGNVLRLQGLFGLRPTAIMFDLEYQWYNGAWRLYGVAISPTGLLTQIPPNQPVAPTGR
ncbi:MAG: hypothetical protein ABL874_12200 [Sphingopyxis sp.]